MVSETGNTLTIRSYVVVMIFSCPIISVKKLLHASVKSWISFRFALKVVCVSAIRIFFSSMSLLFRSIKSSRDLIELNALRFWFCLMLIAFCCISHPLDSILGKMSIALSKYVETLSEPFNTYCTFIDSSPYLNEQGSVSLNYLTILFAALHMLIG